MFSLSTTGSVRTLEAIASSAAQEGDAITLIPVAVPTQHEVLGAFTRLGELAVDAVIIMEVHLLDDSDQENTAVFWDLLHPWRVGEPVERTWEYLRPWLAQGRGWVQLKDVAAPEDPFPVLPGQGVLSLNRAFHLLEGAGYSGALSLEWEKAWHPGAADLEVALGHPRGLFDDRC